MSQEDQSTIILGLQGWEIMDQGVSLEEDGSMVIGITPAGAAADLEALERFLYRLPASLVEYAKKLFKEWEP